MRNIYGKFSLQDCGCASLLLLPNFFFKNIFCVPIHKCVYKLRPWKTFVHKNLCSSCSVSYFCCLFSTFLCTWKSILLYIKWLIQIQTREVWWQAKKKKQRLVLNVCARRGGVVAHRDIFKAHTDFWTRYTRQEGVLEFQENSRIVQIFCFSLLCI